MEKIKKALNGAEAKAQHTFGGKDHSHNVKVKDADVLEGMDSETEQRTKLFKANVEGAAVLVRRLTDFAHKLKELAVVSSNFASETSKIGGSSKDIEHLRACVLPFVKLNKLGEQLEELAAEVATLEKLDFIAVAAQIKKVKKVTKHVESLKKKNDAQALTAEHALKGEVAELKSNLNLANGKYEVLVRKTSVGFSSASVAAAQLLGSELSEGSMVEVQAPPPIHRK